MTAISRGEVPDLNLLPRDLQTHLMSNSNQMLTMFSKNSKGGSIDELLSKLPKWERPDLPTFSPYDINDIHNELVQEEVSIYFLHRSRLLGPTPSRKFT